mmetsp:Transcript_15274/g.42255  ORF Transcript_15274/g.42255 Transcript_15274/m.42255 type:complete len:80 (+) Transcript_15274:233-472(+)
MGFFQRNKKKEVALSAATKAMQADPNRQWQPPPPEYVELGTIQYVNLTSDGKHGDYQTALDVAKETGKPIFCNFVEWSG